jgi:hypothetical protein
LSREFNCGSAADQSHCKEQKDRAKDADNNVCVGSHLLVPSHEDAGDSVDKGTKDDPQDEVHCILHETIERIISKSLDSGHRAR